MTNPLEDVLNPPDQVRPAPLPVAELPFALDREPATRRAVQPDLFGARPPPELETP